MSRIDELIAGRCPDGVEYKTLGEIIENLRTGLNPRQNFKLNTPDARHKYITVRELAGFSLRPSEKTDLIDDHGLARIQARSKLKPGDVLFSGTGTIGRTALVEEIPSSWNIKEGVYALTPRSEVISSRYLIYSLHSTAIRKRILASADGSTVASVSMATLRGIRIPVPPLEVQREIVRILDTFSKMEAELEAELEFRKQQYEHYSSGVLSFSEEVPHLPLEAVISNLRTGLNPRKNFKLNTPDAVNHYITVRELSGFAVSPGDKTDLVNDDGLALIQKRAKLRPGDVLFSGTGTIGRTALVEFEPTNWNIKEGVYALTPMPELILSRFLIYVLHSQQVRRTILASADGSTVASVSMASLRRIRIPLPSLESQEEIVALLDNFETLVNDLSVGLPAELAARRQQYEYYRDKLLTFKELEPAS